LSATLLNSRPGGHKSKQETRAEGHCQNLERVLLEVGAPVNGLPDAIFKLGQISAKFGPGLIYMVLYAV
jgi:hypothetical protein